MDLSVLAAAHRPPNARQRNVEVAIEAAVGVTLLDLICAVRLGR